jgi:hypothetical protein
MPSLVPINQMATSHNASTAILGAPWPDLSGRAALKGPVTPLSKSYFCTIE